MEKLKVALIVKQKTTWKSCQTISRNLIQAYESINNIEIMLFYLPESSDQVSSIVQVSVDVLKYTPDRIVFLEHGEPPLPFFFHYLTNMKMKVNFIFHIYGDYSHFMGKWISLFELLKGFPVSIYAASESQTKLINKTLKFDLCEKISFPVDEKKFFYSQNLRKKFREQNNLRETDILLIYTGRISLQKNVNILIDCVKSVAKNFDQDIHFYLAGNFDDIGIPYLNNKLISNCYSYKFSENVLTGDRCKYLGNLSNEELNLLYNGADIFCSVSTHNDEDFGMSPAESLGTGLKVILTKWGGYRDFHPFSGVDRQVSVKIQTDNVEFETKEFCQILFREITAFDKKDSSREVRSENFFKKYSISSVSQIINECLRREVKPFVGSKEELLTNFDKLSSHTAFMSKSFSQQYYDLYKGSYDD